MCLCFVTGAGHRDHLDSGGGVWGGLPGGDEGAGSAGGGVRGGLRAGVNSTWTTSSPSRWRSHHHLTTRHHQVTTAAAAAHRRPAHGPQADVITITDDVIRDVICGVIHDVIHRADASLDHGDAVLSSAGESSSWLKSTALIDSKARLV